MTSATINLTCFVSRLHSLQIKYKSYENLPLKRKDHTLVPIRQQAETEYIEPMLDCRIVTKSERPKGTKKVTLPTFRKYYLAYKHPFKLE